MNFGLYVAFVLVNTCTSRYALIEGCRWVDEVVYDVPYSAQMNILDDYGIGEYLIVTYDECSDDHLDFVVHGDDIAMVRSKST